MHSLAVVATGYGVGQPPARRRLGHRPACGWTMRARIATVRDAAHELSRFVEDAYAEN